MASFVVLRPPGAGEAGEVFVRDGFHLLGFLAPPLWLLWHRLWIEAALAFAAIVFAAALVQLPGVGAFGAVPPLLVGLFAGLEGAALRVSALRRRGWDERGIVEAANAAEAEIRFYAGQAPERGPRSQPPSHPRSLEQSPRSVGLRPALGLFNYPR